MPPPPSLACAQWQQQLVIQVISLNLSKANVLLSQVSYDSSKRHSLFQENIALKYQVNVKVSFGKVYIALKIWDNLG